LKAFQTRRKPGLSLEWTFLGHDGLAVHRDCLHNGMRAFDGDAAHLPDRDTAPPAALPGSSASHSRAKAIPASGHRGKGVRPVEQVRPVARRTPASGVRGGGSATAAGATMLGGAQRRDRQYRQPDRHGFEQHQPWVSVCEAKVNTSAAA
jgi:hypothetical protein